MGSKYSFGRVSAKSAILLWPHPGPLCKGLLQTILTECWPFFTLYLPLINNHIKQREAIYLIDSDSKNPDKIKTLLLIKNLQFFSNHHETWSKLQTQEVALLTKFHDDSSKIVDFLLAVNFWSWPDFFNLSLALLQHFDLSLTHP